jgi:hypothetical protein
VPERRDNADQEPGATTVVEPSPVAAVRPASPERVARSARFAPDAVLIGWLAAWGAATLAAACLREAGVDLGLGLGIASGDPGVEDRLLPGVWVLVIQAGAFVIGGYAAGRLARGRALLHAGLAWAVAMLVTGADAIVDALRDEGGSVLARLDLPHWSGTGLSGAWEEGLALAIIALAGLAGALFGGSLAAAANARPAAGRPPAAADG